MKSIKIKNALKIIQISFILLTSIYSFIHSLPQEIVFDQFAKEYTKNTKSPVAKIKREALLDLFSNIFYKSRSFALDPKIWQEISLFSSEHNNKTNKTKNLLDQIDRTKTELGRLYLAEHLAFLQDDKENLEENRNCIQEIESYNILQKNLNEILEKKFQDALSKYLLFYSNLLPTQEEKMLIKVIEQEQKMAQLIKIKKFHTKKAMLEETNNKFNYYFAAPIIHAIKQTSKNSALLILYYLASCSLELSSSIWNYFYQASESSEVGTSIWNYFKPTAEISNALIAGTGIIDILTKNLISNNFSKFASALAINLYIIPHVLQISFTKFNLLKAPLEITYYFWAKIFENKIKKEKLLEEIIPLIISVKNMLTGFEQIYDQIRDNKQFASMANDIKLFLDHKQSIFKKYDEKSILEIYKTKNLNEIIELLAPIIEVSVIQDNQSKNLFVKALRAVGKIDALLSLAKLINEEKYCLVNYVNYLCKNNSIQKKPYIKLTDFYNPLAEEKEATNYNMTLQTNSYSEKTDQINAFTTAIILSNLGIAPAKSATITPGISYIKTAINQEDIAQYINQISDILTEVKQLPQDQFGLVIIHKPTYLNKKIDFGPLKQLQGLLTGLSELQQNHQFSTVFTNN